MKTLSRVLLVLALVALLGVAPAVADTLWYNGNFDYVNGLANAINMDSSISPSAVYDDFIVPVASGGWYVNTVWSNNLMDVTGITSASWEIRSGVSAGNGGTLVASGLSTATQTATGRSSDPYLEYKIQVSGLNVKLDPGTYWLSVSPVGSGTGLSYNSTTSGASAVGQPPGNDGNSFFDSTLFGYVFEPTSTFFGSSLDFSMGVGGTVVPVPAAVWLLGSGLVGLWGFRRRKA
jgi:hypothetical protein